MGTTQHIPAHLIDSKCSLLNQDKISGASHHLLDSMILFGEHSPANSIAAPGNNLSARTIFNVPLYFLVLLHNICKSIFGPLKKPDGF